MKHNFLNGSVILSLSLICLTIGPIRWAVAAQGFDPFGQVIQDANPRSADTKKDDQDKKKPGRPRAGYRYQNDTQYSAPST